MEAGYCLLGENYQEEARHQTEFFFAHSSRSLGGRFARTTYVRKYLESSMHKFWQCLKQIAKKFPMMYANWVVTWTTPMRPKIFVQLKCGPATANIPQLVPGGWSVSAVGPGRFNELQLVIRDFNRLVLICSVVTTTEFQLDFMDSIYGTTTMW